MESGIEEEVKGHEQVINSNFLGGSKIPSIGCFVTLLSLMGSRKEIKHLLKGLSKAKGFHFYKTHVKGSSEFSDKENIMRD
jgi:hypothetical protein